MAPAKGNGDPSRRTAYAKSEALQKLSSGWSYFAPIPKLVPGTKAANCAHFGSVLWADIDGPSQMHREDAIAAAANLIEQHLMGFFPNAVVYSGNRGFHLYWKLDQDIEIDRIESYTKQLAVLLDGDTKVCERNRLMRSPGARNAKSGRFCELLDLHLECASLKALKALDLPEVHQIRKPRRAVAILGADGTPEWLCAAHRIGGWGEVNTKLDCLSGQMRCYLDEPDLGREEFKAAKPSFGGGSRSEIEQSIINHLVNAGWSDRQIEQLADAGFAKHRQALKDGIGRRYLVSSIAKARRYQYEAGRITSQDGGWPKKRDAKYRQITDDEVDLIVRAATGQPMSEWVASVADSTGKAKSSVYKLKDKLIRDNRLHLDDGRRIHQAATPKL